MSKVIAIIPARYASSRFPGKPLVRIHGRPMLWHVMHRTGLCPLIHSTVLATDDQRIFSVAQDLGLEAILTRADHRSGTDRVLEAAKLLGAMKNDIIVNVQGDEPALQPAMLTALLEPFADQEVQVTTLGHVITAQEALSPDRVKIVRSADGRALYFSRAVVPHGRGGEPQFLGHIGIYAFQMQVLEKFTSLGESPLERLEKLEQLRLLEAGIPIHVVLTPYASHGVDRPEDVPIVSKLIAEGDLDI